MFWMNKFTNLILLLPMIFNLLMMLIMMLPSKLNNFHPIMLLLILIILTIMISLKINFMFKSWIPLILFLIMIGGLMIIFMYITSLSNNELFNFNLKLLLINMMKIMPIMFLMIYLTFLFKVTIMNFNFESFNLNNFMLMKNQMNMNIMYKEMNNKSSYFIMLYLYFSMICIMNICYKLKAPLRQILF
uniref:NADH-ubiquinone oxidoreductase chain 6 n=1 Tax=Diadromus collaris TaxID=7421 RepID=U5HTE6_9HYME|nr:NADH dehydrogenase subunit 6 [Diadromus collaris]